MQINAEIKTFKSYIPNFALPNLQLYDFDTHELQNTLRKNSFLWKLNTSVYGVSVWTGPKRTRTYPYQHVYNTMHHKPRLTLIPFVKDEGRDGDRDFLQWDTISLMTLLGVHVIITYHKTAERSRRKGAKNREKISNHQIDVDYVARRIEELVTYSSDVLHWNRKEIEDNLPYVVEQAIHYHQEIEQITGVSLHSISGIKRRLLNLENFQEKSRQRSKSAQARELLVSHTAESLTVEDKAAITITNFYNGEYNFTVDEIAILRTNLFLIEKKHVNKGTLPSVSDIKDGLLKIMLYCQLERAFIGNQSYQPIPVIGLTANLISGYCHSLMNEDEIHSFFQKNSKLTKGKKSHIEQLFDEARRNQFFAYLAHPLEELQIRASMLEKFSNSR